jgi:transcription termination factor NusB
MSSLFTKNKKEKHKGKARSYALQCLYTWYVYDKKINITMLDFLKNKNKNKFDIKYFNKIVLGVVLHTNLLNKFFLLYKKVPTYFFSIIDILIFKIALFEFLSTTLDMYKKKNMTESPLLLSVFSNTTNTKFINTIIKNIKIKHF